MAVPAIVETGLNEAGTAVAVIVHPERGAAAILEYVNEPFAAVLKRTASALMGVTLQSLLEVVAKPECRARLIEAVETSSSSQHDIQMAVGGVTIWFGVRLSFPTPGVSGVRHAILIGRDITQARRAASEEEKTRQMLMQVFMRINVAVAILGRLGEIVMCNASFRQLAGCSPEAIRQLRIPALTTPERQTALNAANEAQLRDGQPYEIDFDLVGKDGTNTPIRLCSTLLSENDRLYRITTLLPRPVKASGPEIADLMLGEVSSGSGTIEAETGEARAISLQAMRIAIGIEWERVGPRAMLRAEQSIRKRMGAADLLSRSGESKFIIWFDSIDRKRNEKIIDAMTREIRLMVLTEFGDYLDRKNPAVLPSLFDEDAANSLR